MFSQNQVRHFFVATANKATAITPADAAGTVRVRESAKEFWIEYVSPNGDNGANTIVRSDLIPKANITNISKSESGLERPLKKMEISFPTGVTPIAGQDYIVRFMFFGLGIGGVENHYIKDGAAYRAKTGDSVATVLTKLKESAELNFSREPFPYVKVTATSTALVIEEVEAPWVLGKKPDNPIDFKVFAVPVKTATPGIEEPWGEVKDVTSTNTNKVGNGKKVAEMEWFLYGERADQYREMGFPNNFNTTYLANPNSKYKFINVDFFYAGNAEDVQKSPKTLTIATADDAVLAALETAFNIAEEEVTEP